MRRCLPEAPTRKHGTETRLDEQAINNVQSQRVDYVR